MAKNPCLIHLAGKCAVIYITGLYLFQVSICKTLERDELDHLALQGNKGRLVFLGNRDRLVLLGNKDRLDQKDQKVKRVNDQKIKEKNENCIGESLSTFFASLACAFHSL